MPEDAQLLRQYAESGSEAAFTILVERHCGLVYQAALRQLGDNTSLARDVTQAVFILLSRKAKGMARHPSLVGWLHSVTHFISMRTVRAETRRKRREAAAQLLADTPAPGIEWERIRPVLDGALLELSTEDRAAVLLRYFESRPIGEIASGLRITEAATYKRIERAIERLRSLLEKRGITSSAGALAAILGAEAATGAPAGLTTAVVGAATAGGSAPAAGSTLIHLMSTTKLTFGVFGLLATIGAGALLWSEHFRIEEATIANFNLQARNRQLYAENARLIQQAKSTYLGELQKHIHARTLENSKKSLANQLPREALALHNAGQTTPRSAAETLAWACDQANTDVLAKLIAFDGDGHQKAASILAALPESAQTQYPTPEALYALFFADDALTHPLPPETILNSASENYQSQDRVSLTFPNGRGLQFQNTPDGWKFIIPADAVQQFASQILLEPK